MFGLSLALIIASVLIEDVRSAATQLPTQTDGIVESLLGRQWTFVSANHNNYSMRHKGHRMKVETQEVGDEEYIDDIAFNIVPGLCGMGVTLQSKNFPDHFVRHQNFKIWTHTYESKDATFIYDACWLPREGLSEPGNKRKISFESVNYPKSYIRHSNWLLWLQKEETSTLYKLDSTFIKPENATLDRDCNNGWELIYGNDNAVADGHYTFTQSVGIEASPVSLSQPYPETASSWSGPRLEGMPGIALGRTLRQILVNDGVTSSEKVSDKAFRKYQSRCDGPGCETQQVNLATGAPVYIWQWHLYCDTADGAHVDIYTNLFGQSTALGTEPADP